MIDWAALVADSTSNVPEIEAKDPCSDSTGRNKPQIPEKVGTAESPAPLGFPASVPTVPTVPTVFERSRVEDNENSNRSSFIEPAGGGFEGQSAPHKAPVKTGCRTCANLQRPGLSDGYCGSRPDLPPAYTTGHPLRCLPDDGGANCPDWLPHPLMA